MLEGSTELHGHGVVQDGVDGTVNVDQRLGKHKVPVVFKQILLGESSKRVVDKDEAIGHPKNGKQNDHND